MFQDFYDHNFDLSCLNRVLICLIPKVKDVSSIKNFRPISLLNCSYKIFIKVLSNSFFSVLDRIIGSNQIAFLKGRYTLDAVVTAHKILHYSDTHDEHGLILKLDFETAFDIMDWKYLLTIFKQRDLMKNGSNGWRVFFGGVIVQSHS